MMTVHTRTTWYLAAAVMVCLLCASPTRGADRYWIDPLGGPFNTTTNWSTTPGGASGASVPTAADTANFTLINTYTVTFGSSHTNTDLAVVGGAVTFDLNTRTYTLTAPTSVIVGDQSGQIGRLTVMDGTLAVDTTNDSVIVADGPGSTGYLTVTTGGRIGTVAARPSLSIGNYGTGTLTVSDNGQISGSQVWVGLWEEGTGTATITGPNATVDISQTANIGFYGTGTINVQNGGTLTTAAISYLGYELGANGSVFVTGLGSNWSSNTIEVGHLGNGTLSITSGGLLSSTAGYVGNLSTGVGSATVSGANSSWNLSSYLSIGEGGFGTLTISDGGRVTSTEGDLAYSAGEAYATVTGTGSLWEMSTVLLVGRSGFGSLAVASGGEVSANSATLGSLAAGVGTATITGAGSRLTVANSVTVGAQGSGTLTVADNAEVYAGTDLIIGDPAGAPIGTLNLDGGSIYVADDFLNSGAFNFTNGLLQVSGDFQHSGTATAFRLNGDTYTDLPTLDLIGGGANVNMTDLTVGDDRAALLRLRQGRFLSLGANSLNVGAKSGGQGTVTVESSAELQADSLSVGGTGSTAGGTGTLNITNATVITSTLRLFDDGEINFDGGLLAIDSIATLEGRFNWTSGELFVPGLISLSDSNLPKLLGPDRTLRGGQILRQLATVDITAAMVIDGGLLDIGTLNNHSTLDIRSGVVHGYTTLSNSGVILLNSPLAELSGTSVENSATVRGTGAIAGGEFINTPSGQVEVIAGDRLRVQSSLISNTGHISVIGGELQVDGSFSNLTLGLISARDAILRFKTVGNDGSMAFSNGTVDVYGNITQNVGGRITVSNGGIVNFYDDVTIAVPSAADVQATALGSTISRVVFFGAYNGGVTGGGQAFIEGDHRPGNSPALVEFGGDVFYGPFASLGIELAGPTQGVEYDSVLVAGETVLGGTLDVSLLGGFAPGLGDTFEILTATGGVTGMFANELLPNLGALLALHVFYDTSAVTLAVVPALAGDYNADGIVDAADYAAYRNLLGQTGIGLVADGNQDGQVTPLDYDIWRSHYGQTVLDGATTGNSSPANVPEPASICFLALFALFVGSQRWGNALRSRSRNAQVRW